MTLFNLSIYNLAALFLLNTAILIVSVKIVVDTANSKLYSKYFVHSVFIFLLSFFLCKCWQRLEPVKSTLQNLW